MHKVNYGMVPTYIADLIPPLVNEISGYPFRNNNHFSTPFTQTNVSTRSCIPSAIRMWNYLDESLYNKPTISSFKHNLQTTTFQKIQAPSFFAFGKRHLSVLHAGIRIICSNLNNDLFNNHLCDNPLCSWRNETEDGEHYFFHCSKFRNERHKFFELARDFQPLTINILLYGYETLKYELNIELFSAVHEYTRVIWKALSMAS